MTPNIQEQITTYESFEGVLFRGSIRTFAKYLGDLYGYSMSVLDVGCGDGTLIGELQALGWKNVEGFDANPNKIEVARKSWYKTSVSTVEDYAWDKEYDLVVCSHVLEHIVDPRAALANMIKVARKHIVIVVPFPDIDAPEDAHIGRSIIGTNTGILDVPNAFFSSFGKKFTIECVKIREPEMIVRIDI